MNRRRFLLSASLAVLTAKLLTMPTLAATTPSETVFEIDEFHYYLFTTVERAFRTLEDLKLGPTGQLRCLGMQAISYEHLYQQRDAAHRQALRSSDFWKRLEQIETIRQGLLRRFGPDVNAHLYFLSTQPLAAVYKYRDHLELGPLSELQDLGDFLKNPLT